MTFLEYVIESYLGLPLERTAESSKWTCPNCQRLAGLWTMRPLPQHKDRFRCEGCSFRGDDADFLGRIFPQEGWTERRGRLEMLRADFERDRRPSSTKNGKGEGEIARGHRGPASVRKTKNAIVGLQCWLGERVGKIYPAELFLELMVQVALAAEEADVGVHLIIAECASLLEGIQAASTGGAFKAMHERNGSIIH